MSADRDLEFRIAKLQLAPGDVLVVKSNKRVTPEAIENAKRLMVHVLPPEVRWMFIDPEIELSVLTRAEIEARAA